MHTALCSLVPDDRHPVDESSSDNEGPSGKLKEVLVHVSEGIGGHMRMRTTSVCVCVCVCACGKVVRRHGYQSNHKERRTHTCTYPSTPSATASLLRVPVFRGPSLTP